MWGWEEVVWVGGVELEVGVGVGEECVGGVEGEGEVDGVSGGEGGVGEVGACPVEGGADGGGVFSL